MARRSFQAHSLMPQTSVRPSSSETVTRASENSSSSGSGNIPQAAVGIPVAGVLGRKRVPDANTIWTGNLRPITQTITSTTAEEEIIDLGGGLTETVTTTVTTTTTNIIGYYVDIHMGICLGPDVKLRAIYVDNQPIWTGNIGPARTTFTIGENVTFLSGAQCVFSGGAYNQAPEPDVDVADYPGYVGIATILLKNVRADLPMGNLSFEVTRAPNPLGLSGADNLSGDDLNVMSALVEVCSNEWGWGGLDISNFDVATLSDLAEILADEGNYCSIKIGSEVSTASLIKGLQDQAAAIVFANPETNLITGALIRASNIDYVNGARFNMKNTLEIRSFEKSGWQDTIEQARGLYTERDANYNDVPVFMQNTANISQSGRGKRTATLQYPFVPNKNLCLDLLSRDLAILAAPIYGYSLLTNRDGASLLPGTMMLVTWPDHNLLNCPMVALKIRKQDIHANNVVVQCRQMKFPETDALYGVGGAPYDPGFDTSPQTPTAVTFLTAPYFMARARHALSTAQVSAVVYPLILPKPANNFQYSFTALIENSPGATSNTINVSQGLFPTFAELNASIGLYDDMADGIITAVVLKNVINGINLVDVGNQGVKDGRVFMVAGSEIMSFESVTNNGDGTFTLNNVHRALLDTVAQAHSANDDVYIIGNNYNYIGSGYNYPLGFTPDWLVISNTLTEFGIEADALASSAWVPSSNRTLSPPRPHNTKVNGTARSSTPVPVVEGASVTVTWSTRSRTNGKVALQLDAAESPEIKGASTQQHRVFHRSSGGTVTEIGTGLYSGNTATFTMPNVTNGVGSFFVQAEIVLAGVTYTSIARDLVPVDIS